MPGPAPKPDAERRRRNATVSMTRLPAEGRKKRAPNWPLIPDVVLTARRDLAQAKVERLDKEAEATRQSITTLGRQCEAIQADCGEAPEATRCVRETESKLGPVDVLVLVMDW